MEEIIARLDRIEQMALLQTKELLNVADVALLTGYSRDYIRELAQKGRLAFYRPGGRMIFFERKDVLDYIRSNKVESIDNNIRAYENN